MVIFKTRTLNAGRQYPGTHGIGNDVEIRDAVGAFESTIYLALLGIELR